MIEDEPILDAPVERSPRRRRRRDVLGSLVGLLVFLGGVALLILVFRLAYTMFQTPPTVALQIEGGKAVDLASASDRLSAIIVRIILLIIMALTGSLVANRGIHLYARSIGRNR
ncbi:MAG: hypothetical protein C4320_00905 [Armatimonadota bacterium]